MRPKIKDYFGDNATLQQVVDTYKSQPELFNYAQALDWQVDKLEEANDIMLEALKNTPIVSMFSNAERFITAYEQWRDKYKNPALKAVQL